MDYGITWSFVEGLPDVDQFATGGCSTMYCGELFTSYVSHDDGLSWSGLGIGAAFTILAWDEYAFIGNNEGIFFSEDSGDTWTLMNQGMNPYPNNAVQGLTRIAILFTQVCIETLFGEDHFPILALKRLVTTW
jgi:hypothetical protein